MSWSLVRAARDTDALLLDSVRQIPDAEGRELQEAIGYCRAYSQRVAVQLVLTGRETVQDLANRLAMPMSYPQMVVATQEFEVNFVAFLLLWRLFLDHTSHDLSQRFGKPSPEFDRFNFAASQAYDAHPGYRFVDGMRNYVQHVGMPGLVYSIGQRRADDGSGSVATEAGIKFNRDRLLEWKKCPRLLREDMNKGVDAILVMELLDDAMHGFMSLVGVVAAIDEPGLARHTARLQALVDETAPHVPVVADLDNVSLGKASTIRMIRFDDLAWLLDLTRTTSMGDQRGES